MGAKKRKMKFSILKGQSSLEFFVLAGVAVFFFLIFSLAVQMNIGEKTVERTNLEVKELASSVQDEINLAAGASDGYRREFYIPEKVANKDYQINIVDDSVYVRTDDGKFALSLPVSEVIGDVLEGNNFITKINGKVYINTLPAESEGGFSPSGDEEEETNLNFIRGDANMDGTLDISDGIYIKNYLYHGGPRPSCLDGADANDNGIVDVNDALYLENYLFSGGPEPFAPYPTCGTDMTFDELSCNSYVHCAQGQGAQPDPTPIPTGTPVSSPTPTPTPTPSPSPSPSGS